MMRFLLSIAARFWPVKFHIYDCVKYYMFGTRKTNEIIATTFKDDPGPSGVAMVIVENVASRVQINP
jgi:hypothetical protein